MINLLVTLAEETTEVVEQAAVDQLLAKIIEVFNTPLIISGGVTITIGAFIYAILQWFFPKNKTIANQEKIIAQQDEEIAMLKQKEATNEARIATLEARQEIIIINTPNKRVQEAKNVTITPEQIKYKKTAERLAEMNAAKKVKVKVKKAVANNGN